jgi:hypothetical protein
MRIVLLSWCLMGVLASGLPAAAMADEGDGCSHFSWDVSHELAVMKQTVKPVTAATKAGTGVPALALDTPYELKLSPQSGVNYAAKPVKPTLDDSAQGGLVRFHVKKAGLYRVSITSGHWIDVVDGDQPVKSKDFQGSRGCERPHKIVEFELSADKDFVLQFSGSADASVIVAITPTAPH